MANNDQLDLPQPDLSGYEDDYQSNREVENWRRLDELSNAKFDTTLAIHKTVKFLIPSALVVGFLAFSSLAVVYVLHLLLPTERRWLTSDEVQHIHAMIFSGVVGGAVAILAKMYLTDPKNGD